MGQSRVQGRVEEGRHRAAVHLQGPQEGDRAVQAAAVGSSRRRARGRGGRLGEDVRLSVRAAARHPYARHRRPLRAAAAALPRPAARRRGRRPGRSGGGRVSERGAGFGSFLLGLGIGAVVGFLFAPEGEATRGKLAGMLRRLRARASWEVDELGQLPRFPPTTPGGGTDRAFQAVESALSGVVRHRGRLTAFGLPLFVWFSSRLFGGVRAALNEVFDTDEQRPWPVAKLLDLAMVLGTGALLVLSGLVAAWEAGNAALMSTSSFALDWLWRFGLETAAFAAGVLLFFGVFKLLPSRRIHWRTALVAAVFCSLGFEVAKRLYALYVTRFATLDRLASDANVVALALFLLWVYYTAYLFLLGGEVAETYDLMRMRRSQRVQLG